MSTFGVWITNYRQGLPSVPLGWSFTNEQKSPNPKKTSVFFLAKCQIWNVLHIIANISFKKIQNEMEEIIHKTNKYGVNFVQFLC